MDDVSKDVVSLLLQLFPGFIAAWILYGLTSYPKPSQFERVAQAVVFSFLIKVLVVPEHWALLYIGQLFAATVTGILFGLSASYLANNDRLYRVARRLGLTKRTAYPSEWYGALTRKPKYVVLHLDGDRRISGWPLQWPSDPRHGHFELAEAAWLTKDWAAPEIPLDGVDSILIAASAVQFIEFLKPLESTINGAETGQSAPAPAAAKPSPPS
jgi:hypothetical protein